MQICFIIAGLSLTVIGLLHEWCWFKKRNGKIQKGTVIGSVENSSTDGSSYHPIVRFHYADNEYEFTSEYARNYKPINEGTEIEVLVPENPKDAEWYSLGNRLAVSLACIIPGIGIITIALNFKT